MQQILTSQAHTCTHEVLFTPAAEFFQLRTAEISPAVHLPQFIRVAKQVLPQHTRITATSTMVILIIPLTNEDIRHTSLW